MTTTTATTEVRERRVSLAEFRDLAQEQVRKAVREKEEGSRLFGAGRVEEAEKKYVESLVLLDAAKSVDAMGREDFRDILGRVEATELLCHLNLAACALNQKRYEDALESSKVVLSMDERNVKAMYRAGRALFATSNFGESARILKEAARLSPSDRSIAALLTKARASAAEVSSTQKATFGGIFAKSSYIMQRTREEEREAEKKAAEMRDVAAKLKPCIQSAAEVSLLDRWAASGPSCLDSAEVDDLNRVAQRAAASGKLDMASDRAALSAHGLRLPSTGSADSRASEKERREAQDQGDLVAVRALTQRLQEGQQITQEEADFLQGFRRKEIRRLEEQLRGTGLNAQESAILDGLRSQENRYERTVEDYEDRSSEVESLLKRLESGRRIPVRQRLRMDQLLNEERARLEKKDDDQGLTSTEWKLLRQIQENQEEKKKEEETRRERAEQRKQMLREMA